MSMTDKERLARIADIIERVDNRAMAGDGNVLPTLTVMTQDEISSIYALSRGEHERWRP
jgi:predicted pyridoxine 5'-phosphate oxidase superfamily flavin-nucleotide-binding protein